MTENGSMNSSQAFCSVAPAAAGPEAAPTMLTWKAPAICPTTTMRNVQPARRPI